MSEIVCVCKKLKMISTK